MDIALAVTALGSVAAGAAFWLHPPLADAGPALLSGDTDALRRVFVIPAAQPSPQAEPEPQTARIEVVYWGSPTALGTPRLRAKFKKRLVELARQAIHSDDSLSDEDVDIDPDDDHAQATIGHVKIKLPFTAGSLERPQLMSKVSDFLKLDPGQVDVKDVREGSIRVELTAPEWLVAVLCSELLAGGSGAASVLGRLGDELELGRLKGIWVHDQYVAEQLQLEIQVPEAVADLKARLEARQLSTLGEKAVLVARLKYAVEQPERSGGGPAEKRKQPSLLPSQQLAKQQRAEKSKKQPEKDESFDDMLRDSSDENDEDADREAAAGRTLDVFEQLSRAGWG